MVIVVQKIPTEEKCLKFRTEFVLREDVPQNHIYQGSISLTHKSKLRIIQDSSFIKAFWSFEFSLEDK